MSLAHPGLYAACRSPGELSYFAGKALLVPLTATSLLPVIPATSPVCAYDVTTKHVHIMTQASGL
jgi:hypothetical protein